MRRRGEHRLPHNRVVDQEEQIRGRAGELVPRDASGLGLDVVPSRGPVAAKAFRIQGAEALNDRALHRVMQAEPLRGGLHERQPTQCPERVVRVVAQHRGEDASGDTPRDRSGVQHAARVFIEARSERTGQRRR